MPAIDKQAHFWAGAAIGAVAFAFSASAALSIGIVAAAALTKEVRDAATGRGVAEALDLFFTVIGGVVAVALCVTAAQL